MNLNVYLHCRTTEHYYQDPVEGRGSSTSLYVAQDGGASVEAELLRYQLDTQVIDEQSV